MSFGKYDVLLKRLSERAKTRVSEKVAEPKPEEKSVASDETSVHSPQEKSDREGNEEEGEEEELEEEEEIDDVVADARVESVLKTNREVKAALENHRKKWSTAKAKLPKHVASDGSDITFHDAANSPGAALHSNKESIEAVLQHEFGDYSSDEEQSPQRLKRNNTAERALFGTPEWRKAKSMIRELKVTQEKRVELLKKAHEDEMAAVRQETEQTIGELRFELQEKEAASELKLKALNTRLQEIDHARQLARSELNTVTQTLDVECSKRAAAERYAEDLEEDFKRESAAIKAQAAAVEEEMKNTKVEAEKKITGLTHEKESLKTEVAHVTKEKTIVAKKLETTKVILEEKKQDLSQSDSQLTALRKENRQLIQTVHELKEKVFEVEGERDTIEHRVRLECMVKVEQLREQLKDTKEMLESTDGERIQLLHEIDTMKSVIHEFETQRKQMKKVFKEMQDIQQSADEYRRMAGQLHGRCQMLTCAAVILKMQLCVARRPSDAERRLEDLMEQNEWLFARLNEKKRRAKAVKRKMIKMHEDDVKEEAQKQEQLEASLLVPAAAAGATGVVSSMSASLVPPSRFDSLLEEDDDTTFVDTGTQWEEQKDKTAEDVVRWEDKTRTVSTQSDALLYLSALMGSAATPSPSRSMPASTTPSFSSAPSQRNALLRGEETPEASQPNTSAGRGAPTLLQDSDLASTARMSAQRRPPSGSASRQHARPASSGGKAHARSASVAVPASELATVKFGVSGRGGPPNTQLAPNPYNYFQRKHEQKHYRPSSAPLTTGDAPDVGISEWLPTAYSIPTFPAFAASSSRVVEEVDGSAHDAPAGMMFPNGALPVGAWRNRNKQ